MRPGPDGADVSGTPGLVPLSARSYIRASWPARATAPLEAVTETTTIEQPWPWKSAVLAVCLTAGAYQARAASIEYVLDLPANQTLEYEVEFEVAYPGVIAISAVWSPSRVLVLRLERPGQPDTRRSGPPPLRLELDVEPADLARDTPWLLVISGLPFRDAGQGRLTLWLPDPPGTVAPLGPLAPLPVPPEPKAWTVRVAAPPDLDPQRRRLFEAMERFRLLVVQDEVPDSYHWQDGLLQFLAGRLDAAATGYSPMDRPTRAILRRIVRVVEQLDALRQSRHRPLSGPVPTDPVRLRLWQAVRDPRFVPIAEELDELLTEQGAGHAPESIREDWAAGLLSCLVLCERHFEQTARLGIERADHGEVAEQQWDRLLAAADVLRALDELSD